MPSSKVDVIVIGAGPVGMVCAAELARYGVRVRLVDKRPGPVTHSHASVIHLRTQDVLEAMGVLEGWLELGYPFEEFSFNAFGKHLATIRLFGADGDPHRGPLDIGQDVTERLLLKHLTALDVIVERPVEATAFSEGQDGARVTLSRPDGSEEVAEAHYVIGCEGSSSVVRRSLGIEFEGSKYSGYEFIQADAQVKWGFLSGRGHAFITKERFLGLFPFGPNGFYRVLCARPDTDQANRADPTLEEMQQIVREIADPAAELSEPKWLNRFRAQHRIASHFQEGRSFLAGDAGHVHVPIAGQGMNTGIQDAFNLAWKLAYVIKGWAAPPLLDSYNLERHAVAKRLIQFTDTGFNALARPNTAVSLALKFIAGPVLNAAFVQQHFRASVSEVDIHYRQGPLSENHDAAKAPQAGDRAFNARVVQAVGRYQTSLFDAWRGTTWTLLMFEGDAGEEVVDQGALGIAVQSRFGRYVRIIRLTRNRQAAAATADTALYLDLEGDAHERYSVGTGGAVLLVRPDGYVGFRGLLQHCPQALAYLNRHLVSDRD